MYSCAYIMDTALKSNPYIVEHLLYPGLYILAGAPKIGKSWLALDLCLSVAEGEPFLKHETHRGQVLYLALEDSLLRLQNRLYEFTDEPSEGLRFSTLAKTIGSGLEQQLEDAKCRLPDLRLIVIDTLQKVRRTVDVKYGSDYSELSVLKSEADKLGVAILLIHHTRKERDSDPFNMISGTTGIIGCADGSFVLVRESRSDKTGNRDFLDMCYKRFQQHKANGCKTTFQYKDHLWTLYLYEQGLFMIPENSDPDKIYDGCHCAIGHMTILPTGDVYACRRMESKIGNVFDTPMYELFLGADSEEYRQFDKFEKCSKCELRGYCRGCPAVTFGYTGNMYAPDPQCWAGSPRGQYRAERYISFEAPNAIGITAGG